jgi:hypothetical protein
MPNYCDNSLTLSHKDKDKVEKLYQAILSNSLCNAVIPLPEVLRDTTSPSREPNEALIAEFGTDNWYDFCVSQWGTKWDIIDSNVSLHDDDGEFTITASFLTAWCPPLGIYHRLIEDGFEVSAMYFEGGMCFAGTLNNEDGESYYEDFESIPNEIKDEFGIHDYYSVEDEA